MGHCGPLDVGAAATRPMQAFGSPAMDTVGPLTYCQLNAMLDAAYPKGALNYWKANFLAQLSDEAIDTMIECFATCPRRWASCCLSTCMARPPGSGAARPPFPIARPATTCSCCLNGWSQAETERCIAWARDTYTAMQPFMASGRYVNYLADDESGDPVAAAYGPNYRRLQELKAKYDPSNFFHMNQNIRPFS